MGTKLSPGAFDCYANAADDEPMFILLGRDKHAPTLVWLWATLRELDGEDPKKVAEARKCVSDMIAFLHSKDRQSVGLGQALLASAFDLIRMANAGVKADNSPTDDQAIRRFLSTTEYESAAKD